MAVPWNVLAICEISLLIRGGPEYHFNGLVVPFGAMV